MNAVKLAEFALNSSSAFVSIDAPFVDMAEPGNPTNAITAASAIAVSTFGADNTAPQVTAFALDLENGELRLSFSEPVSPVIDTTKFVLQNSSDGSGSSRRLSADSTVAQTSVSLLITVDMTEADVLYVKDTGLFGNDVANTYIAIDADALLDTVGNGIVEIASGAARQATQLFEDTTAGTLLQFDMSLADRTLTLTFDEVMDASEFFAPAFFIMNSILQGDQEGDFYQLTTSTTNSADGSVIVVDLSVEDTIGVGAFGSLAVSRETTFLRVTADGMQDVFGRNMVSVVTGRALQVSTFTPDNVSPAVSVSTLDMSALQLRLDFSEIVNTSSLVLDGLQFQAGGTGGAVHPINTTDYEWNADQTELLFKFNDVDEDALKSTDGLCDSQATTHLIIPGTLIKDYSGNSIDARGTVNAPAQQVTNFTEDGINPVLQSFSLDLDDGIVGLTFSEVMRASSLDATKFSIQAARDITGLEQDDSGG